MKHFRSFRLAAGTAAIAIMFGSFDGRTVRAVQDAEPFDAPQVFQAAGPDAATIQSAVDRFRAALGGVNNGNAPGPIATGRREINWDGGGSTATSPGPTPFQVFLVTRGAQMTTPGTGFVQAPADGLATIFMNPSLAATFQAFSPVRLFAPLDSNVTDVTFFLPGGGNVPAVTSGFAAVFADVDSPDGGGAGFRRFSASPSTRVTYYDRSGAVLYRSAVASSPGTATLSFFGLAFANPRIAKVRIVTGQVPPDDAVEPRRDVVVMDDFIYGEPQIIQ